MKTPRINNDIKRISIIIIMVCAAIIAGLIVAGKSRADGILTSAEQSIGDSIGSSVCMYIDSQGVNRSSMANLIQIIYQSPYIFTYGDAVDVINYAVEEYCPSHWRELVSFGEGARA